jgi:hypothetical protein
VKLGLKTLDVLLKEDLIFSTLQKRSPEIDLEMMKIGDVD